MSDTQLKTIAGRDVLWLDSNNPDHSGLISQVRGTGSLDDRFGESVSVELHIESDCDISLMSTQWFSESDGVAWHKREFSTRTGGKLTKFNAELPSGDNVIYIKNESKAGRVFMKCATQNAVFITGAGDGWVDTHIGRSYLEEIEYTLHSETYFDAPNIKSGGEWWVRLSVLSDRNFDSPYNVDCGAIGPHWSPLDSRICKELPVSAGNPITNSRPKKSYGLIQNWNTSKCLGKVLPDSIAVKLSGGLDDCSHLVMCRSFGGSYVTGFIHDNRGYRLVIEQVNPIVIGKVSPTNPWSIMALNDDGQRGTDNFRCTLMEWDKCGCSGLPLRTRTIDVTASCDPFTGIGSFGDIGIKFDAIDNVVSSSAGENNQNIRLVIDSSNHAVTGNLQPGKYIVTISRCCAIIDGSATGQARVVYNGKHGTTQRSFPRQPAGTLNQAKQLYQGSTIKIEHVGGQVSVDLVANPSRFDGEVEITFTSESFYRGEAPSLGTAVTDCSMHAKHVHLLQNQWANSNCTGLVAEVLGQEYIVVMTDDKIPCIGHGTAIAWPTLNSTSMVGVPAGGTVPFKIDKTLSEAVMNDIASGRYISSVGDVSTIKTVMFPVVR